MSFDEIKIKTIKLKPNGLGRYDDVSPFIITDNKLELKTELPNLNGEFYLIAENNGKLFKKLLSRECGVVLEELTAGELQAEIKHYLKGELIKSYKVEPLMLREVDGKLSGEPEIAALRESIDKLTKCFDGYKKEAEKREVNLEKNIAALTRFALKDYENNVYLDGGSFEKFITEFGFQLTEEEIKSLKGEEDNVD